jgi:hypothetical protein
MLLAALIDAGAKLDDVKAQLSTISEIAGEWYPQQPPAPWHDHLRLRGPNSPPLSFTSPPSPALQEHYVRAKDEEPWHDQC